MAHLLTVFGTTGNQGGSLIAYVLKHPKLSKLYKLRGITRDPSKPAAVALREKGVEIVRVSERQLVGWIYILLNGESSTKGLRGTIQLR